MPPKDRLWFKENCICAGSAGCGNRDSARFKMRLDEAKVAREAQEKKDAEARAAREQKDTEARAAREKKDAQARKNAAAEAARRKQVVEALRWRIKTGASAEVLKSRPANPGSMTAYRVAMEYCRAQGLPGWLMPDDFVSMSSTLAMEVVSELEAPR